MPRANGKPAAFLFFQNDWMASMTPYPADVRGVHISLLAVQAEVGGLPKSVEKLAKIVCINLKTFRKSWQILEAKYPIGSDGLRRNPRLAMELDKQLHIRELRRKAAHEKHARHK